MINYNEIGIALQKEIDRLRIEATSQRLSDIQDQHYIVGMIDGINLTIGRINDIKKRDEDLDDDL